MKICFFVRDLSLKGGISRATSSLLNELIKDKNLNISIISMEQENKDLTYALDENINYDVLSKDKKYDVKKDYFKLRKMTKEYLENKKFDIMISVGTGFGCLLIPICIKKKIKIIIWDHCGFDYGSKVGITNISRIMASKMADSIIVLTKKDKFKFEKKMNLNCQVTVIHNSAPDISGNVYNNKVKKIVSVGELIPSKGFDIAIDIASKIFEIHKEWKWHIYGEGYQKEILQKKINEKGLGDNIKLCGYCQDIYSNYKNYSFIVMTSKSEGLGMVLLEAAANKLPLISFDCPNGPGEIILNEKNGYLIEDQNIDQMTEKILNLIENEKLREKFSENSNCNRITFESKYIVKQWKDIFEEVIKIKN